MAIKPRRFEIKMPSAAEVISRLGTSFVSESPAVDHL